MSTPPTPNPTTPAPSKVEAHKLESRFLRGTIARTLADPAAPAFDDHDLTSLKFHGVYQQDDRDARAERARQGLDKAYMFMIRVAAPGGIVTPEQYLALDELADTHANGTLRLTTRQAFQFHGVVKHRLHETMRRIHDTLLTSLAACGDIPRNVMAPPAPFAREDYRAAQALARTLARELAPRTGAYHEIWVDGEPYRPEEPAGEAPTGADPEEPFYGPAYLPRKFKLGVGLDTDNSIDLYAYDAGLVGITREGRVLGYNLLVGGGLGMTHNKPDTIARLASPIAFVEPALAVDAVRAAVAIYRDHGNRSERRHARIKYLIEAWGVGRFREELESRLGRRLEDPRPTARPRQLDHVGRFAQGDGREFVGVFVENGRVSDRGPARYRGAFRRIVDELRPGVRLTPMQSVLFTDLSPGDADRAQAILREHGVPDVAGLSQARRYSMACVALPTCGLALTDAERQLPDVIDELELELSRLGLSEVPLTVRMTGCPNGCARPYNADVGLVGRRPGVYHLFVGGGLSGDRLADLYLADVPTDRIVASLRPLLERFAAERGAGEGLSDFYRRALGRPVARTLLTGRETPTGPIVPLTVEGV